MIHHIKKLMEKKNHMISSAKKAFEKHLTPIFDLKKKNFEKNRNQMHFLQLDKNFPYVPSWKSFL